MGSCILLLSAALVAQTAPDPVQRLTATILGLKNAERIAVSERLTGEIVAASERRHPPKHSLVVLFSDSLTGALASRELVEKKVTEISKSIVEVLQSAGIGTHKFKASVDRLEQSLKELGVAAAAADATARRLSAIGRSVRGPEDLPVQPLLPLRQFRNRD
jgi:hypothetical protein